jgi:hypothetical protein
MLEIHRASQSDARSYKALDAWIKTIAGCRSLCGAAVVCVASLTEFRDYGKLYSTP